MPNIACVLSGCGHLDGAEIREAVLALLYLDQQGAEVSIFAPDVTQKHVINHLTGQESMDTRNVLEEAARIARGKIAALSTADARAYDALVIPGGFGVAKNLSNFVDAGANCEVNRELQALVRAFYAQKKPILAICIAPAVLMAALQGIATPTLTIGEDTGVASAIVSLGGTHECCTSEGCVVDKTHRIVTTSAYMRNDRLYNIAKGIETAVTALMTLIKSE